MRKDDAASQDILVISNATEYVPKQFKGNVVIAEGTLVHSGLSASGEITFKQGATLRTKAPDEWVESRTSITFEDNSSTLNAKAPRIMIEAKGVSIRQKVQTDELTISGTAPHSSNMSGMVWIQDVKVHISASITGKVTIETLQADTQAAVSIGEGVRVANLIAKNPEISGLAAIWAMNGKKIIESFVEEEAIAVSGRSGTRKTFEDYLQRLRDAGAVIKQEDFCAIAL